jgi:hypothetical protein
MDINGLWEFATDKSRDYERLRKWQTCGEPWP